MSNDSPPTNSMPNLMALLDDEREIGKFQVQIARMTSSGWTAAIPPLYATVTDQRLMLKPQTRRPYPPAIIPARYIRQVTNLVLDPFNAVELTLTDDYRLYLIAGWRHGHDFSSALRRMMTERKLKFNREFVHPDMQALYKLIDAVKAR